MEPTSDNIVRASGNVDAATRRAVTGHGAATLWFTGLSGSGKSTLAYGVEHALLDRGVNAFVLDGDNVRFGLNGDLGFAPEDRAENIRRIGHVARLLADAGVVVLCSFVSPYREDRDRVRALHDDAHPFAEVFVDVPLAVAEARDVKGLYARARAGEIAGFTGIDAPYEAPEAPELRLDTDARDLDDCVAEVVRWLEQADVV
jgi:adenylylsulfate kinase